MCKRLFLLSHMRAYTSLIGHILGSHPRINGYYEMHQSYVSNADLAQQLTRYSEHDALKADALYQFDKLLHNDYRLNLALPALQDAVVLIALREPESSIKSTLNLFRQKVTAHPYAEESGATHYYIARLQALAAFAEQHPQRYYYFAAERIVDDTPALLTALQQWLGLTEPLSSEYQKFAQTGVAGAGDTSVWIHTGKVLPGLREDLACIHLADDLLQQAQRVYQECHAHLQQCHRPVARRENRLRRPA
ncbi:MAG: sulfotransferase family protein, partial [Thiothrix sp.]